MLGWKKNICARKKRCFSGMSSLRHLNAYQLRYTDPPKCVHLFGWSIRPDVFVIFFGVINQLLRILLMVINPQSSV